MTQNQIAYLAQKETERANRAREQETNRYNVESANLKRADQGITLLQLDESSRHNRATERQGLGVLSESIRSNRANEQIKRDTLSETHRSNIASEAIKVKTLDETKRSNQVKESQTDRQLTELERSNLANEAERNRSNTANESLKLKELEEKERHNYATERTSIGGALASLFSSVSNQDIATAAPKAVTQATQIYNDKIVPIVAPAVADLIRAAENEDRIGDNSADRAKHNSSRRRNK